MERRWI